jgi:hypothetical protein
MFTIGVNMLTTKLIYYLSHKIICWQHTLCNPCITKWLCLQHTWCIYVAKQTLQIGGTYKSGRYLFLGSLTFVKSLKFEVQFYYRKSLKNTKKYIAMKWGLKLKLSPNSIIIWVLSLLFIFKGAFFRSHVCVIATILSIIVTKSFSNFMH